jgi:hypothetical protein
MLETKAIDGVMKSTEMKLNNANRAKLSPTARQIYLQGFASLSKAENVAAKGNEGRGFILPNVVVAKTADDQKPRNKNRRNNRNNRNNRNK